METFSALFVFCAGNSPVNGEFPAQKASDTEICCFLWSANGPTVEQTMDTPMIRDDIALSMTPL